MVPLLRDGASLDAPAIEVGHDGGAADTKAFDELRDRGAALVVVDECIDLNAAQSALRKVSKNRGPSLVPSKLDRHALTKPSLVCQIDLSSIQLHKPFGLLRRDSLERR